MTTQWINLISFDYVKPTRKVSLSNKQLSLIQHVLYQVILSINE